MSEHAIVNTVYDYVITWQYFSIRANSFLGDVYLFVSLKQGIICNYGVTKAYIYHLVNRNFNFIYPRAVMTTYISSINIIEFTCSKLWISSSLLSWTFYFYFFKENIIVLSVLLRYADSDYSFGICKRYASLRTQCILLHYRKLQIKIIMSIITYSEFIYSGLRGKMFWTTFLAAFSLDIAAL